jgi:uncharacterized phage-associated protein
MKLTYNFDSTFGFSVVHKERVGQLINYLALKIKHLYCTKLIKLLYIIDEESMKKNGIPISWLTYKVFEMGPVPDKLWYSIKDGNTVFGEFFNVIEIKAQFNEEKDINYRIEPISKEELSEFSRSEINIINDVIKDYGHRTSKQLIEYLHREESLWHMLVKANNISFDKNSTTTYNIDLSDLISHDKNKLDIYHDTKEEIDLLESLS